jgi:hypothetical protein
VSLRKSWTAAEGRGDELRCPADPSHLSRLPGAYSRPLTRFRCYLLHAHRRARRLTRAGVDVGEASAFLSVADARFVIWERIGKVTSFGGGGRLARAIACENGTYRRQMPQKRRPAAAATSRSCRGRSVWW